MLTLLAEVVAIVSFVYEITLSAPRAGLKLGFLSVIRVSMSIVAAHMSLNVRSVAMPLEFASGSELTEMFPRREWDTGSMEFSTMIGPNTVSHERTLLDDEQ